MVTGFPSRGFHRGHANRWERYSVASGIMLSGMIPAPMKFKPSKQVGSTPIGIPNNAKENLDKQVALFSKLVKENPKRAIFQVWSKLDSVAHSVILSELNSVDGKVRAEYYEWAREDAAELKKHARMLRTFLKKQAEHESIRVRRPRCYMPRRYIAEPEGSKAPLGKCSR